MTALIKEAVVAKTAYKEATQQGRQFQSRVEDGGKAYEWAPSCKTYMRFIKFLDQCDKELTEFGKDILLLKPKGQEKHIKKEYTTETLLVELPKFLEITTATEKSPTPLTSFSRCINSS